MVRAVNKLILEINNTENEYFEKAVFYIRPEMAEQSKIRQNAQFYMEKVAGDCAFTHRKKNMAVFAAGITAAVCSSVVTALIFIFLT